MGTGGIIIAIIVIVLVLIGIGVGLYFLLRPKKTDLGCTGVGCTGTTITPNPNPGSGTTFLPLNPVGCTGAGCTLPILPCTDCTPGPTKNPPPGGFTGTVPTTSWAHYVGGIDLNNIREIDNITSLSACQTLCINEPGCQMIQFDSPNSHCFLQQFTDSPGVNVSLLNPSSTAWFTYKDKQINANVVQTYNSVDSEDVCRASCKTFITANSAYHNQVLAEYTSSLKQCLCVSSTRETLESYLIK
jgi:hypothetical protein